MCQFRYPKKYEEDKIYAISGYAVVQNETAIQKETMINGPVQTCVKLYEDFNFYKSGIYKHTWGEWEGAHAVKLIGRGVENGTKYWIISNSWNYDWGENGESLLRRVPNKTYITQGVIVASSFRTVFNPSQQ
ncbi:papain family cysteine protease [Oesophagostomum dentatum]|uniref:Papain family cysteine protease n=1 Tax=Oesophagostomum dentatum TaxID=61180 RepID=A0A0B1SGH0_OESDE|nr:papain family cysteine protease [Oesophagostomum dentatum]